MLNLCINFNNPPDEDDDNIEWIINYSVENRENQIYIVIFKDSHLIKVEDDKKINI